MSDWPPVSITVAIDCITFDYDWLRLTFFDGRLALSREKSGLFTCLEHCCLMWSRRDGITFVESFGGSFPLREFLTLEFLLLGLLACIFPFAGAAQAAKPKLTLDEFFNSVGFESVKVSPEDERS